MIWSCSPPASAVRRPYVEKIKTWRMWCVPCCLLDDFSVAVAGGAPESAIQTTDRWYKGLRPLKRNRDELETHAQSGATRRQASVDQVHGSISWRTLGRRWPVSPMGRERLDPSACCGRPGPLCRAVCLRVTHSRHAPASTVSVLV